MLSRKLIASLFVILIGVASHAAEFYEYNQNVRSLGMGGVQIPFLNNGDALFINPAALANIEGLNFQLIDFDMGINGLQMYETFQSVQGKEGMDMFNGLYGKNIWFHTSGRSVAYFPYFAFGAFGEGSINFRLQRPAFPEMRMGYLTDYGFTVGTAFPLGPLGSFGLSLRQIQRQGTEQIIGVQTIAGTQNFDTLADSFSNKGIGYGADLGFEFSLPIPASPVLGVVWRDIGGTAFTKTAGADAPVHIADSLNVGFGWGFDLPGLDGKAGIEYRHLNDYSEQVGKKLHMGVELGLAFLDLRAGFYQGYTSYGLGFDLWLIRFDLASYTVETGAYPGQTGDGRIQASMMIDIGFDPSFHLLSSDSNKAKKRKVKQRR